MRHFIRSLSLQTVIGLAPLQQPAAAAAFRRTHTHFRVTFPTFEVTTPAYKSDKVMDGTNSQ